MARLSSKNQFNGAIGGIIFYESQGRTLARSKPGKVRNPQTPAQQQRRMRFAASSKFLKPFRDIVKVTFTSFPGKSDGYSSAMSYNMAFGTMGGYPDVAIDFDKALISFGSASLPSGFAIERTSEGFEITWDSTLDGNADKHDLVIPVLYNKYGPKATSGQGSYRHTGRCKLELPSVDTPTHCWVFVKASKANWDRQFSMSKYLGEIGG